MTATDAIWTQGGSFTAAEDRSLISALTGARHFTDLAPGISKVDAGGGHGVVGASDLAVTPGSGHSVDVAAGQAFIRGTQSAGQGTYLVGNDATVNLAVSTPDATNDRIDLIQIRVSDDSAGAGVTTIDVKAGTPAGSPAAPTPDENALVLAQVLVPASAASSANYTITDRRTRAYSLGGTGVVSSSTRPSPAYEGQVIYETDTNRVYVYDGSTWQPVPTGRRFNAGTSTASSDAGGNITIAHGLGAVPTSVVAMLRADNTASVLQVAVLARGGIDATNFVIYVHRSDGGGALPSTAVKFDWIASS